MTGYSRDEAVGETPWMLQGEKTSEHVLDELIERLSKERHFIGETVNYRKSGEEYVVRWSIDPVKPSEESGVTHWVSIQLDITDDALANVFQKNRPC